MGVEEGTSNGEGEECGEEIRCFKGEPVNNGFGFESFNGSGDGSSGASENFRTYKRRRQLRSSSKIKQSDGGQAYTDQVDFLKRVWICMLTVVDVNYLSLL